MPYVSRTISTGADSPGTAREPSLCGTARGKGSPRSSLPEYPGLYVRQYLLEDLARVGPDVPAHLHEIPLNLRPFPDDDPHLVPVRLVVVGLHPRLEGLPLLLVVGVRFPGEEIVDRLKNPDVGVVEVEQFDVVDHVHLLPRRRHVVAVPQCRPDAVPQSVLPRRPLHPPGPLPEDPGGRYPLVHIDVHPFFLRLQENLLALGSHVMDDGENGQADQPRQTAVDVFPQTAETREVE